MSVNSQNFAIAVAPTLGAIPHTTVAAPGTTNGTTIDLQSVAGAAEVGFIGYATAFGGSATVIFKVQGSADGTNWFDLAGFASPSLSAAGAIALSAGRAKIQDLFATASSLSTVCRYVRLDAVVTVGATFSATYSPFQLMEGPNFGLVNGTDYVALSN